LQLTRRLVGFLSLNQLPPQRNPVPGSAALADPSQTEARMNATRIEMAVDQMESYDDADDFSCDDVRTAWLCAELNRSRAGVSGSFEALWLDR
jgi:hypothetical protein